MRLLIIFFFINLSIAHAAPAAKDSPTIQVDLSDVPPFSYIENGKIKGINVDIAKQLEKKSKLKFQYNIYPHGRMLKVLKSKHSDVIISFRIMCEKNKDSYEVQTKLFSLMPIILLKKSVDPKKQDIRVGRLIGTCQDLSDTNVKKELLVNIASLDLAFKMLKAKRLDGVCANAPVLKYNLQHYKEFKNELTVYRVQADTAGFDAVICRKKSLPTTVKKKLERAAKEIVLPNFQYNI